MGHRDEPRRPGSGFRSGDGSAHASAQVEVDDPAVLTALAGPRNENLRTLESEVGVAIGMRGHQIHLSGPAEDVAFAERVLAEFVQAIRDGRSLSTQDVARAVRMLREHPELRLRDVFSDVLLVSSRHRVIAPKGLAQKKYIEAIREHDIVFGIGPAGTGKCIAGDSFVLTEHGMIPIAELVQGTKDDSYTPIDLQISGIEGPECASHFYDGGVAPTKKITTRMGFSIEATHEHPLLELTPEGEVRWTRADALKPGSYVGIQRGQNLFGNETAIQMPSEERSPQSHPKPVNATFLDEELSYFLGLMVGDGCMTFPNRVIFSSADAALHAVFERVALRFDLHVFPNGKGRPYDRIIASSELYRLLIHLGLAPVKAAQKEVPRAILRAPRALVLAFLRGLFDTDGTVDRRRGYPSLSSASAKLIAQVQLLLLNLGIIASRSTRNIRYDEELRTYHQLEIRGGDAERFFDVVGFDLFRKQVLQREQPRNTNIDVIPHMATALRTATMLAAPLPRAVHKLFDDYKRARRNPSYEKLGELLSNVRSVERSDVYQQLRWIVDKRLFWAEVTSIEDGKAHVYDLTVPGTHSFCANGFVNHNTYLAMAMAVSALMNRQVKRIILTRPAVEAGEKLGFLPGDLAEKVNPYLRPLYDAMHDMMDMDKAQALISRGQIEVAPLAFMRGRTLNDSFVILDEAQNTTPEQMKMFLTRLGYDSKAIITGDVTQVDLPEGRKSGLVDAIHLLADVEGIKFNIFTDVDVVRHQLVARVVRAYEARDAARERAKAMSEEREEREEAERLSRRQNADGPERL